MRTIKDLELFIQIDILPEHFKTKEHLAEIMERWEAILQSSDYNALIPVVAKNRTLGLKDLLHILVQLINKVQGYLYRSNRYWKRLPFKVSIRKFYFHVIDRLSKLLDTLLADNPLIASDVQYTHAERAIVIQQLLQRYHQMEHIFNRSEIDPDLSRLVTKSLFATIKKPGINRRTAAYIFNLIDYLTKAEILNTTSLIHQLYLHDFNVPEFFMYRINSWEKRLTEEPSHYDQLEIVICEQDCLRKLEFRKHNSFVPSEATLRDQLNAFLLEKKQTLKELIKLKRMKIKDSQLSKLITRIRTTLPVAQLALFIRLQIEKGILAKEHVGRIFGFYATHFYNAQTDNISPESLQKKSTDAEYATAQKLKAQLIGMINWLNEHFKFDS